MAETHTTPTNLNKNENVPINSRIMVTSPAGETTTAAALAFLDVITTCTSAADAENKVVQIPDYTESVLPNNLKLHVTFANGNTYGDTTSSVVYYPKLAIYNANSQLIGTLDICDSRGHYAGSGFCNAGDQMDFVRVGDKAKITNSDIRQVKDAYTILSDGQSIFNTNQVNGALGGVDSLTQLTQIGGSAGQVNYNIPVDMRNYKKILIMPFQIYDDKAYGTFVEIRTELLNVTNARYKITEVEEFMINITSNTDKTVLFVNVINSVPTIGINIRIYGIS